MSSMICFMWKSAKPQQMTTLQEKAKYLTENDHEFQDFIAQLRMKKKTKCLRPSLEILSQCIDERVEEIKRSREHNTEGIIEKNETDMGSNEDCKTKRDRFRRMRHEDPSILNHSSSNPLIDVLATITKTKTQKRRKSCDENIRKDKDPIFLADNTSEGRRVVSLPDPLIVEKRRTKRSELLVHLNVTQKLYKKHHEQLSRSKRNLMGSTKDIEYLRNTCFSPFA